MNDLLKEASRMIKVDKLKQTYEIAYKNGYKKAQEEFEKMIDDKIQHEFSRSICDGCRDCLNHKKAFEELKQKLKEQGK